MVKLTLELPCSECFHLILQVERVLGLGEVDNQDGAQQEHHSLKLVF